VGQKPLAVDGYIRVSRRLGREGAAYISPTVQREAIQRWADYRQITVAEWHTDEDESGGTQNRPGLKAALHRVETGETGGLACWRLNRFARNVSEALRDVQRIRQAGGVLACVEEDIDPTGPFGEFILTVLLAVGALELNNVKASWETAKTRAVGRGAKISRTPYGYQRQDDGTLQPDPAQAPIVAEAFHRARDHGLHATIDYLTETVPQRTWTTTTVRRLLGLRAYLGEQSYGDLHNPAGHPPLIDRLTFELAQPGETVKRRGRGRYPLSGLARCGSCGHHMVGGRGGPNIRMYRCGAAVSGYRGVMCTMPALITADSLEEHVTGRLARAFAGTTFEGGGDEGGDLAPVQRAVDEAEAELAVFASDTHARRLLGEQGWTVALEARAAARDRARTELREEVERLRPAARVVPDVEDWAGLDADSLGHVLRGAFSAVVVRRGRGPVGERVTILSHDAEPEAGMTLVEDANPGGL